MYPYLNGVLPEQDKTFYVIRSLALTLPIKSLTQRTEYAEPPYPPKVTCTLTEP